MRKALPKVTLAALLAVLATGHGQQPHVMHEPPASAEPLLLPASPSADTVAYMCPIHSDYTSALPGTCPRDGMPLIAATPFDVRDYALELATVPALPKAGETVTLELTVRHPESGEIVHDFEMVHDKRYHLFVVSQDLSHFEHIHPEQGPGGAWSIDVVLPRPGHYKVLSDFVPRGGAAQFIARPLVTAGYTGDLIADRAELTVDANASKTVGDLTATVTYDPPVLVAGLYGHLDFYLTDAGTGAPVTDLQPYLGAFGHTLILSEDLVDYVHSHPIDLTAGFDDEAGPMLFMLPMGVDPSTLRGGPEVTFDGLMPRVGRYRAFTQFLRRGELHTFAFTFEVVDVP